MAAARNGGIAAPRRAARGRRRSTPRQEEIRRIGRGAAGRTGGQRVGIGGGQQVGPRPQQAQRVGIGAGGEPGLGHQLTRRVQAGEIDHDQAVAVARQRQTLAAAFGPDWREQVFGELGAARDARAQLAQDPSNPALQQQNAELLQRRQAMLEQAKERISQQGGARPAQRRPARRSRRRPQRQPVAQAQPVGRGY